MSHAEIQSQINSFPLTEREQTPPLPSYPQNCPEKIYEQYLAEKEDWLAKNPYVRTVNYRSARGLPTYPKATLREEASRMPFHISQDLYVGSILSLSGVTKSSSDRLTKRFMLG
jgi:hypothetical protein